MARVQLDYVTPRFRNFSPGEFVWQRTATVARPRIPEGRHPAADASPYYDRLDLGFRREGDSYVLDL